MTEPLTLESLAKRVAELEAKLAAPPTKDWTRGVGMFAGDEGYDEIARLGAAIRQAERDEIAREDAELDAKRLAEHGDAA